MALAGARADVPVTVDESLCSPDPVVRAAVLDVLRQLQLGGPDTFAAALRDDDRR
jgi:hypothetical protein